MKKYMAVMAVTLIGAGLISGCGASGKDIGQDKAKEAAFSDAGVRESDVTRLKVSKDKDDGQVEYEIEFSVGEKGYSYDISGANGEILSSEVELETVKTPQTGTAAQTAGNGADTGNSKDTAGETKTDNKTDNNTNAGQSSGTNANVAVNEADAIKTALERVPGATEQDLRMKLDFEDGYYVYEGDIIYEQREYEFEIDAQSGEILKWEEERR